MRFLLRTAFTMQYSIAADLDLIVDPDKITSLRGFGNSL